MKVEFVVDGPILGYRQTTKKTMFHKNERARSMAYGQFKNRVLIMSIQAGIPNMGLAKKERMPRLSVAIHWAKHPKIDWKNVYGAIEDALWYQDDRYVKPGKFSDVFLDTGVEKAVVTVEF